MPSDPPHTPDEASHLLEQDPRVVLALILDSQRALLPTAERLMQAQERRELAAAGFWTASAKLVETLAGSYWSAPSLLVAVIAAALVGLHIVGVETQDLVGLADVAAHAWTGEPHCPGE